MANLWTIAPTIAAWTLGVLGLLLILSGLFRDRSRGRKRCPRCWYDMSGAPNLQCPECGRTARSAQHFLRTRRRWRVTIIGLLLLTAPGPLIFGSRRYPHEGVNAFIPTTFLIAFARFGDADPSSSSRGSNGTLFGVPVLPTPTSDPFTIDDLSNWSAQKILDRYRRNDSDRFVRTLSWHAAHGRLNADLDLDPPVMPWVMQNLLRDSDPKVALNKNPRHADLVTVLLRGPTFATVGLPLCVELTIMSFNDDNHIVTLQSELRNAPTPPLLLPTPGWFSTAELSNLPSPVVDLGPPSSPSDSVFVTARIWTRREGMTDDQLASTHAPDAVRRVRLNIPVRTPERRLRQPVAIPINPFADGIETIGGLLARRPIWDYGYSIGLPPLRLELPNNLAVGVRVDLMRNNTVVSTGGACLWNPPRWRRFDWGGTAYFGVFTGALARMHMIRNPTPAPITDDTDRWAIRIASSEAMACWHIDADSYWVGEIIIPLEQAPTLDRP